MEHSFSRRRRRFLILFLLVLLIGTPTTQASVFSELWENTLEFFGIIKITKANHLDSNRERISNIYPEVRELDNLWSEEILNGEYVRVTFQIPLDNTKDITIYPRVVNGTPRIEIYEFNQSELIAEFTNIKSNEYNKVLLTNLIGEQDTFDLKILDGAIEFNHILDPPETFYARTTVSTQTDCTVNENISTTAGSTNTQVDISGSDTRCWDSELLTEDRETGFWEAHLFTRNVGGGGSRANVNVSIQIVSSTGSLVDNIGSCEFIAPANTENVCNITSVAQKTLTNERIRFKIERTGGTKVLRVRYDGALLSGYESRLIVPAVPTGDTFPQWFDNSTNSTDAGTLIEHRVRWTDDTALSGYIFSFDNGTGNLINDSFVQMTGLANWSNVTKFVNQTIGTTIQWRVYANDSINQLNSTDIFSYETTGDIIPPTITIDSPLNITYSTGDIDYNITVDQNLSVALASVDSESNFTLDNDTNTHYFNLSGNHPTLTEGIHNITFWVNDTAGNANESTVFFTVDLTSPNVQFENPTTAEGNFSQDFIEANVTASDSLAGLDTITIFLYNSTALVQQNLSTTSPLFVNFTGLPDETYTLNATANDTVNNENSTETRTIILDTTAPTINYVAPTETSGVFRSQNFVLVNVTATDPNLDTILIRFYNSSNEQINSSLTTSSPNFINFTSLSEGLYFYNATANDTFGNDIDLSTRNITLDTTNPLIEYVAPTESNNTIFQRDWVFANVSVTEINFANITFTLFNSTSEVNTTTYNSQIFEINFTSLPNEVYTYNVTTVDLANNENSTETRFITLDTTIPTIEFVAPTEANNTVFARNWVFVNVSVIEINEDTITFVIFNSTSLVNSTSFTDATREINFTNLPNEIYRYNVTINDTIGNSNNTETRFITLDTLSPTVGNKFINVTSVNINEAIKLNVTVTDNIELDIVFTEITYPNGTIINATMINSGGDTFDLNLSVGSTTGTFYYNTTYANDTAGNLGSNTTVLNVTVTSVADNVFPQFNDFLEIPINNSVYSFGTNYQFNSTVTFSNDTVFLDINSANNSANNLTGFNYTVNVGELSAGNYDYYWWAFGNGTSENFNSSAIRDYTIQQAVPIGNLTFSPSSSITYPTEVTIGLEENNGGDSDVTYVVFRDNVSKGTGETIILGVGTYDYLLNTTGGTNYTTNASMDFQVLTVSQNTTYTLNLTIFPSTSVTYPTETNASGIDCPDELTCNLFREGVSVSNPNVLTLAVGTYNYTFNTTGNANYSANTNTTILTVNANNGACSVVFNETSPLTYPSIFNVSTNCTSAFVLYRNGTVITNNSLQSLAANTYNFTVIRNDTGNYTNFYDEKNFVINKATPILTKALNGTDANLIITYPEQVNASGSTTAGTIFIYRNETDVTSENNLFVSLAVSFYEYKFNVTGNENYTDIAGEFLNVTVNINNEVGEVIFNETSPQTYPSIFRVYTNFSSTFTIYRNGTTVANNSNQNLAVGIYNFTAIRDDKENYSNFYDEQNFVITQGTGEVFAYINNVRANRTTNLFSEEYLNATLNTGVGDIELWYNDTKINEGTSPLSNLTNFTQEGVFNVSAIYGGNINYTSDIETWYVNVTVVIDNNFPQFSTFQENPANNSIYSSTATYKYNSTVTFTNGTVSLSFDDVNYSADNFFGGDTYNVTLPQNLAGGTYNYYWLGFGNGTDENYNQSATRVYFIQQATPILTKLLNGINNNVTVTYPETINASASTTGGSVNMFRNSTDIISENNQNITLAVSFYEYKFNVTGNVNYTDITGEFLYATINQNTTYNLILTINPSNSVTYPTETTTTGSSCPSELTCNLYRDSVGVTNPEVITLGIGTYNYTFNTTGNVNYSSNTISDNLTVNQNLGSCNVLFDETSPITYPTTFTVWTNCTSGFVLYRNGTTITNNSLQDLAANTYNFTVIRNDTVNYTNFYDEQNFIINQATGVVFTYLNNSRANITINENEEIYLNGTLQTGVGDIKLYNDGTLINQGSSPLNNLTNFTILGLFNITTTYDGNENYTSAFETWWVNVTTGIVTPISFTNLINHTTIVNISFSYDLEASGGTIDTFTLNDTSTFTINSSSGLITNITLLNITQLYWLNATVNNTEGSSDSGIFFINVTEAIAGVNLGFILPDEPLSVPHMKLGQRLKFA